MHDRPDDEALALLCSQHGLICTEGKVVQVGRIGTLGATCVARLHLCEPDHQTNSTMTNGQAYFRSIKRNALVRVHSNQDVAHVCLCRRETEFNPEKSNSALYVDLVGRITVAKGLEEKLSVQGRQGCEVVVVLCCVQEWSWRALQSHATVQNPIPRPWRASTATHTNTDGEHTVRVEPRVYAGMQERTHGRRVTHNTRKHTTKEG